MTISSYQGTVPENGAMVLSDSRPMIMVALCLRLRSLVDVGT